MLAASTSSTDPPTPEVVEEADCRRAPRTNVLLAATVEVDGRTEAVRIRDLSETGALLEGPALPGPGKTFRLRRLHFEMRATVAWRNDKRCGVKLDGPIVIKDWIGGTRGAASPIAAQSRVDDLQAAVRAGAHQVTAQPAPPRESEGLDAKLDGRLAEEIAYIARLLQTMGSELSDNPLVVQRHVAVLQKFDVASQMLGHLAAVLNADDRLEAVNGIGMEDLRARLLRRRLFTPLH